MTVELKDISFPKKTDVGEWRIVRRLGYGGQGGGWGGRRKEGKESPAARKQAHINNRNRPLIHIWRSRRSTQC